MSLRLADAAARFPFRAIDDPCWDEVDVNTIQFSLLLIVGHYLIFTARCTMCIARYWDRLTSVRPSVCLWRWWIVITLAGNLGNGLHGQLVQHLRSFVPKPHPLSSRGTWEILGRLQMGWELAHKKLSKITAISQKREKIEEKLLWSAYRKSSTLFRTVPSPTLYGLPFPIGRHLWFWKIIIFPVKLVRGPHFLSLCEILCKSVEKWPSYGRLTKFKMAAAAILNLLPVTIFVIWSPLGCGWGCLCKIS